MRIQLLTFALLFSLSCTPEKEQRTADIIEQVPEETATPGLTQLWASDTLLRTPESVLYDRQREVIYVANVNLNPWEKDGNGFISRMDLQGNITDLRWVDGLNGPKGMGILDGSLFVADIDEVIEIDLESASIKNRYPVAGTPTLNDITVGNGSVFISGSDSNKVFELKDGVVQEILDEDFGRPNGLYWEPQRLLMLTSNSSMLKSIDLETGKITDLVGELGHGDGIVPDGNGGYLASSWGGELFYISPDWTRTQLLDTREDEINAADIDYIVDQNLVLVPTFFDNRVVAYRFTIDD
jgi:DNA-binding beta-propeller fold protein YncE